MTYPPQLPYSGSEERQPEHRRRIPRGRSQSARQTATKPALGTPTKIVVAMLAVAIAVLSVMAVMTTVGLWTKAVGNEEAYGMQLSADRYDLQHPITEINPEQEFTMTVSPDVYQRLFERSDMWRCTFLCVYADADFTLPVDLGHRMRSSSGGLPTRHHTHGAKTYYLGVSGNGTDGTDGWGGYGQYWLVQWKDGDGEALAKPKVTYFTVKDKHAATLDKPHDPRLSVDDDGVITAAWGAVDGAQRYRVHLITYNPIHGIYKTASLVDTDATSLRMDSFDTDGPCGQDGQPQCDADTQARNMNNRLAELVEQSEDEAMACADADTDTTEYLSCLSMSQPNGYSSEQMDQLQRQFDPAMDVSRGWIGVTALDERERESPLSIVPLDSVAAYVPVGEATYANEAVEAVVSQRNVARSSLDEETQRMVASYHVTMLNGHTKAMYKECRQKDPERYDEAIAAVLGIEATCTVPGTTYTTDEWFQSVTDLEHQQAKVAAWKRGQTTALRRPDALARTSDAAGAVDSQPIGKNGVEQYKPFGSSEYARYVAENLLAMHANIDITQYASVRSAPAWSAVVEEALAQNTHLRVMAGDDLSGIAFARDDQDGRQILHVRYDPQAQDRRDAFHARVQQAAAEIADGSTSEGVAQIETYLARHEKPDTSYALSFDAIADQIGLPSVLVTGWAQNGPHIWNRVLLDGRWQDFDGAQGNADDHTADTHRLKDANTLDGHTTDARWLLHASIDACGGTGTKLEGDEFQTAFAGLYDAAKPQQRKSGPSWAVPSLPPQLAVEIMMIAYLAFTIYFILERSKGGAVARQAFRRRIVALAIAFVCFATAIWKYGDMSNARGIVALLVALSVPPLAAFWSSPNAASGNRRTSRVRRPRQTPKAQ